MKRTLGHQDGALGWIRKRVLGTRFPSLPLFHLLDSQTRTLA